MAEGHSLLTTQTTRVTERIIIPPKLRNSLARTGHKLFQSISEGCRIVFSSSGEAITITGTKDAVAKAKQQFLEMQCKDENLSSSCSADVRAKVQYHKFLMGKNGVNIKKIMESTGAQIIFPTEDEKDKEVIRIVGKRNAVIKAKTELESSIKEIDNITESETITMEQKHHRHFVARGAGVLHQITEECGGVQILLPRAGINSDRVVIKGAPKCIKAAKERMLEIVQDLESMVTIECEIPRKHRRVVIGAKGCKVQAINAEFNVQIRFPDRFSQEEWRSNSEQSNDVEVDAIGTDPANDVVRITGQPGNAEAARKALLNLVPITIQVDVPNNLHSSIIGKRGRDVKELMEKYDVNIVLSRPEQNIDYVMITGAAARVKEAKEAILKKCKNLEAQRQERELRSYVLKIEVDSEYHPKIIGHSGSIHQKITSDNDVIINFPRIGDPEENTITIIGYEKNVHNARDDIMRRIYELMEQGPTMVSGQVSKTQPKHIEIGRCETSATSSIHTDITGCEGTDVEKRTQSMSNIHKESTYAENISHPTEEVEEVQTEIQKLNEKLKISSNSLSLIREHTNILTDALKHCEDSRDRLTELYNNMILKQEGKMKELRDQLNEQVSLNKSLKLERTQLILEVNNEREECERIIRENQQKYDEKMTKMSVTIKDIEANLKMEREEKSKLVAENNESTKKFQELLSKHQALQVTSAEHPRQKELLQFSIKTLKEKESRLNDELKNKDEKISKLDIDLNSALETNTDLSEIIQSLNQELHNAEEEIRKAKMDFKTYRENVDEHTTREKANHAAKLKKIKSNVYDLKEKLVEITQDIHNSSEICEMLNEAKSTSSMQSDDE